MNNNETQSPSLEKRIQDLEDLMRDVVRGRLRTDFLLHELERSEYIPKGSNELADKMLASYERRYEETCIQERMKKSQIIPLAFGARLAEMRDEMVESEQEIIDLAIAFRRWGKVHQDQPGR